MCRYYDNLDMPLITKLTDVETATESFIETISGGMRIFIPVGTVISSKFPFWYSPELRRNCCRKLYYHTQYKRSGLQYWYDKYNVSRALLKKVYEQDDMRQRFGGRPAA